MPFVLACLRFFQQHRRLRLDGFHATQITELFVGFAFNVHIGRLNAQIGGNVGAHGGNVRRELGLLRDDGRVHVHNAPA